MAAVFIELDFSTESLEFTGCSEEDIAYAKKFWQSGYLLPHVESNIQSADVRQRLDPAPLPGHGAPKSSKPECDNTLYRLLGIINWHTNFEEFFELATFFAKVLDAQRIDEVKWMERLAYLREADRIRLASQRFRREQIESRLNRLTGYRKVLPPISSEASVLEAKQAMTDIDCFDMSIGYDNSDRPESAI